MTQRRLGGMCLTALLFAGIWSCERARAQDINSVIANGPRPPQVSTPQDAAMKALQIRNMQLRNQALQQQIQSRQQPSSAGVASRPASRDTHTYGALNGRVWKAASQDANLAYLAGLKEALALEAPEKLPAYCPPGLTALEFQTAVDQFYAQPENLLVPIVQSLRIVSMKVAGASASDIDAELSAMRAAAANAPERKAAQ